MSWDNRHSLPFGHQPNAYRTNIETRMLIVNTDYLACLSISLSLEHKEQYKEFLKKEKTHREALADVSLSLNRAHSWTHSVVHVAGHLTGVLTEL